MIRRQFAGTVLALALAACGGPPPEPPEPPAPPPLDPTGTYTFSAEVGGMTMTGSMTIQGAEGAYTGSISPDDGSAPATINAISVADRSMTIEGSGPMGPLLIEVVVSEDGVVGGTWSMGGMSGGFTATKN